MLVLTRKIGESIVIDDHIKIHIVQVKGKQVRLGIEASPDTKIHREEVYAAIHNQDGKPASDDPKKSKEVPKTTKS